MHFENYQRILDDIKPFGARLVAVSKTKPAEDILQLYNAGQRIFGENKVQEMAEKYELLPKDIQWHLIGHLQTNKVKYVTPFVSVIHSVDSLKLLQEINKQAEKHNRVIDCLFQIYIAQEETKFGLSKDELFAILESHEFASLQNIRVCGLMGMATLTDKQEQIETEFASLKKVFDEAKQKYFSQADWFKDLSMGMSDDYPLALKQGATYIRVGSKLFGSRH